MTKVSDLLDEDEVEKEVVAESSVSCNPLGGVIDWPKVKRKRIVGGESDTC